MKMLTFGLVSFGVLAASAFQLDMGMNGDVALGESGARIGMRVFAKNWQGTCAGLSDGVDGDHSHGHRRVGRRFIGHQYRHGVPGSVQATVSHARHGALFAVSSFPGAH